MKKYLLNLKIVIWLFGYLVIWATTLMLDKFKPYKAYKVI